MVGAHSSSRLHRTARPVTFRRAEMGKSFRCSLALESVPRAVEVARTTSIPACTLFVDVANDGAADGTAAQPYPTIAEAIAALGSGAPSRTIGSTRTWAISPARVTGAASIS